MRTVAESDLERIIRRVAREEAQRVVAESGAAREYTTDDLPPDLRHRRDGARSFRRECRTGKYSTAKKLGRVWTVDAAEWRRVRAASVKKPLKPRLELVKASADLDDVALADLSLEQAGLRTTRRGQ